KLQAHYGHGSAHPKRPASAEIICRRAAGQRFHPPDKGSSPMSISPRPVLETPALSPLRQEQIERPKAKHEEPLLDIRDIQGNIFPGFLKDHQSLLFLRIADPAAFAVWLGALIDFIATMDEVLTFNRLFKAVRFRRKTECQTVKATWINVAFSFAGLQRLQKLRGN